MRRTIKATVFLGGLLGGLLDVTPAFAGGPAAPAQVVDAATATTATAPAPTRLRLVAVMTGSAQLLTWDERTGEYQLRRVGDEVGSARIVALDADTVTVERGAQRVVLPVEGAPQSFARKGKSRKPVTVAMAPDDAVVTPPPVAAAPIVAAAPSDTPTPVVAAPVVAAPVVAAPVVAAPAVVAAPVAAAPVAAAPVVAAAAPVVAAPVAVAAPVVAAPSPVPVAAPSAVAPVTPVAPAVLPLIVPVAPAPIVAAPVAPAPMAVAVPAPVAPAVPVAPASPTVASPPAMVAAPSDEEQFELILERALFSQQLQDFENIAQQVAVAPNRAGGYRIMSLQPGSYIESLGLRVGDVLQRIDGRLLNTADDAARAYAWLRVTDHFTVDVLRDGRIHQLRFRVASTTAQAE